MLSLSPIYYNLSLIRADARMANEPCAFTVGPSYFGSRILIQIQEIVQVVIYQTNPIFFQSSQNITYFLVFGTCSVYVGQNYIAGNYYR